MDTEQRGAEEPAVPTPIGGFFGEITWMLVKFNVKQRFHRPHYRVCRIR
jgi:hypothetical protein